MRTACSGPLRTGYDIKHPRITMCFFVSVIMMVTIAFIQVLVLLKTMLRGNGILSHGDVGSVAHRQEDAVLEIPLTGVTPRRPQTTQSKPSSLLVVAPR